MPNGTVKWFNKKIGAGFIRTDDGENVSLHYSAIQEADTSSIREGARVCLEVLKCEYGLTAIDVRTTGILNETG